MFYGIFERWCKESRSAARGSREKERDTLFRGVARMPAFIQSWKGGPENACPMFLIIYGGGFRTLMHDAEVYFEQHANQVVGDEPLT